MMKRLWLEGTWKYDDIYKVSSVVDIMNSCKKFKKHGHNLVVDEVFQFETIHARKANQAVDKGIENSN